MMLHSNCSRIDMGRNIRQWNIMCVDDDDYTQLRWFVYIQNLSSDYVCYLTSMFTCLIRSSMFMFVIWTNMYVYDIET
jgi:hypothetical protein